MAGFAVVFFRKLDPVGIGDFEGIVSEVVTGFDSEEQAREAGEVLSKFHGPFDVVPHLLNIKEPAPRLRRKGWREQWRAA